jgi:hypothetical protein
MTPPTRSIPPERRQSAADAGLYNLSHSSSWSPGTIVLGLGYPTTPTNGTAAMLVADVDGIKPAHPFEAGTTSRAVPNR